MKHRNWREWWSNTLMIALGATFLLAFFIPMLLHPEGLLITEPNRIWLIIEILIPVAIIIFGLRNWIAWLKDNK